MSGSSPEQCAIIIKSIHPGAFLVERIMDKNDRIKTLMELSLPVSEYLQKNFHPHTTVVIEVDSIRVEETLAGKVIEYEPD